MSTNKHFKVQRLPGIAGLLLPASVFAQAKSTIVSSAHANANEVLLLGLLVLIVLAASIYLFIKTNAMMHLARKKKNREDPSTVTSI